jgi:hypothetical protein
MNGKIGRWEGGINRKRRRTEGGELGREKKTK